MKPISILFLSSLILSGCIGHSEGEEAATAKEFNKKEFEGAMVAAGKAEELKLAKAREKQYLDAQGGVQEEQR